MKIIKGKAPRCGWDNCRNPCHGVYEIKDGFNRVSQQSACDKCAEFWRRNRKECKLVAMYKKK